MNSRKSLTILIVTLIFFLTAFCILQFVSMGVETKKNEQLLAEISEMEAAIANISDEIEYRETLIYMEKYARETLDLFSEGDVVFVPNS